MSSVCQKVELEKNWDDQDTFELKPSLTRKQHSLKMATASFPDLLATVDLCLARAVPGRVPWDALGWLLGQEGGFSASGRGRRAAGSLASQWLLLTSALLLQEVIECYFLSCHFLIILLHTMTGPAFMFPCARHYVR